MRKKLLFFFLLVIARMSAQVQEDFSDGDFLANPTWTGTTDNFIVNSEFQLQSNVEDASTSYLSTPSEAFDDAEWEIYVRIAYNPSSSNYALFYLAAAKPDLSLMPDGYYVQIGNTADEVSLYVQKNGKKEKIIDGRDTILNTPDNRVHVKVTRSASGNWELFSRLDSEPEYVQEGAVANNQVRMSKYTGVLVKNTKTTGKDYYFDDIRVTGEPAKDTEAPQWSALSIVGSYRLQLAFTEPVELDNALFSLIYLNERRAVEITGISQSETGETVWLDVAEELLPSGLYELTVHNITDLAGNPLEGDVTKRIGQPGEIEAGNLVFNEIMFNPADNGAEYVELFNVSDKLLDLQNLVITTRKSDGSFNTGNVFPENSFVLPYSEIALCGEPVVLAECHACPAEANIMGTAWRQTLNNDGTTLYLLADTLVLDSITYSSKWHHVLIKNKKGVALEKINPALPAWDPTSWHSASSETNFGTPGYRNSQYRSLGQAEETKRIWLEPEAFTPDGDGFEDVCFIRYAMPGNGFTANVDIYTPTGLLLRTIGHNQLLSAEGFFIWDGSTKNGTNANVGVYVLVFDAVNAETGEVIREKLPVVVGAR